MTRTTPQEADVIEFVLQKLSGNETLIAAVLKTIRCVQSDPLTDDEHKELRNGIWECDSECDPHEKTLEVIDIWRQRFIARRTRHEAEQLEREENDEDDTKRIW